MEGDLRGRSTVAGWAGRETRPQRSLLFLQAKLLVGRRDARTTMFRERLIAGKRKAQNHFTPVPLALDADRTVMGANDLAHDREAQAAAAGVVLVGAAQGRTL